MDSKNALDIAEQNKKLDLEVETISKEKLLLEAAFAYYIEQKSIADISKKRTFSIPEFENYLKTHEFPHVVLETDKVKKKIQERQVELEKRLFAIKKQQQEYQQALEKQLAEIQRASQVREQKLKQLLDETSTSSRKKTDSTPPMTEETQFFEAEKARMAEKAHQESFEQNQESTRVKRKSTAISSEPSSTVTTAGAGLNQIIVIPSWGKMIDNTFNGFYLNTLVDHVDADSVILIPVSYVTGYEETMGESFVFITGLGLYYTKFGLSPGEIIADMREITGIVLPSKYFNRAQDLSASVLDSDKLFMTEYMFSIPFSILAAKQTTQMYMRGVIVRNIIHPNKEIWDHLLQMCKDPKSFQPEDGFKILSGGLSTKIPLYTNEILTEKTMEQYFKLTAGLKNIQPKLGKILTNLKITDVYKARVFERIAGIKTEFVKRGYPQLMDWMP